MCASKDLVCAVCGCKLSFIHDELVNPGTEIRNVYLVSPCSICLMRTLEKAVDYYDESKYEDRTPTK